MAKNLGLIEPGLTLFSDQKGPGIEYEIDGGRGRIDILDRDRDGRFVVIELKVSRGRNRALGQILYYMSWVDANVHAGPSRGLIIARDIPTDLALAAARVSGIGLYKY